MGKPERVTVKTPSSGERFARRKLTPGRLPWLRQNGESAVAYADFIHFLMLPKEDRTYANCARATGKSHSLMEKRGQQWSWQLRAAAYEEHYLLLRLESVEAEKDRMFVEHRNLTSAAITLVDAHFRELIKLLEGGGVDALLEKGYKTADIVRLFRDVEKADRELVLDRVVNARQAQEHLETLTEKHAEELATMFKDVMEELELTSEQRRIAEGVVKRHLVGDPQRA